MKKSLPVDLANSADGENFELRKLKISLYSIVFTVEQMYPSEANGHKTASVDR